MNNPASEARASLRANRNWVLLWFGQAVSITGDYVFDTTVVLWIATVIGKGQPWAPAAVGGVLVAAAAPALLVGPFAGVYVDRWDWRRTMLAADACRAVLVASLIALPSAGGHLPALVQLGLIYAVIVAASCFAQFFNPARFALLGAVVDAPDMPRASSVFQATGSFAAIIGPPLAAPLLFTLGVQWALVINAASFVVSFATIRAVRPRPENVAKPAPGTGFLDEFRAGLGFFLGNRVLLTLAIGVIVATLGAGALNALNVFFVPHNLHVAASWLGTLTAGEGAGAIAGALAAGWLATRFGATRVFWAGLIIAGVVLLAYSRASLLAVAIAIMVCVGAVVGAINTVLTPLVLGITPRHLIGRVVAVINPVQQLAAIVSMAVAGFLASTVLRGFHHVIAGVTLGPYDTIFIAAGLLFIVAGLASIAPLRDPAEGSPQAPAAPDPPGPEPDPAAAG
ncbi:MAG TPA: MFS transporter [Streptosporangiaceae bacterium]